MDVRLTDLYVADAHLLAEGLVQPEDAMAVFVGRGGKGRVSPFTVRRSYTGTGGWYTESMALLAPDGALSWRGGEQPLRLRGTSKIDVVASDVHGATVASAQDHELVLLVDGDEVGRAPLAVLDEDPPYADGASTAVLDEALKKSTVLWLEVPGVRQANGSGAVPVWYGQLDGRVYVLTGGSEQHVAGLADAPEVVISARSKEQQSLIARVRASARVVPAADPLFNRVVPVLLPRRLNLRDGEAAAGRWKKECVLVELTPSAVPAEA